MPLQDAGHTFCPCAMTCASEFASAFCDAIYISRYYHYIIVIQLEGGGGRKWGRARSRYPDRWDSR